MSNETGFKALYAMDAYQHVVDGTKYPAVMLITGYNDPRVSSWELAKFAARLQTATASGRPIVRVMSPNVIVLESTGGFEAALAAALVEAAIPVAIVNPAPSQRLC